jgi:hypothetical protein
MIGWSSNTPCAATRACVATEVVTQRQQATQTGNGGLAVRDRKRAAHGAGQAQAWAPGTERLGTRGRRAIARVNGTFGRISEERMALAALEGGHIPVQWVKIAQEGAAGAPDS